MSGSDWGPACTLSAKASSQPGSIIVRFKLIMISSQPCRGPALLKAMQLISLRALRPGLGGRAPEAIPDPLIEVLLLVGHETRPELAVEGTIAA